MKSNVMPSIVQIEAKELKQLVSEVRETVATRIVKVSHKKAKVNSFGIVDLWNVRRNVKTAQMLRRW